MDDRSFLAFMHEIGLNTGDPSQPMTTSGTSDRP